MLMQSFVIPIIKVTDSCNFKCKFCYYAQRALHSKLMSANLCKKIIEDTFEYNIRNDNSVMRVIFHGGEPLLQPIAFYEEIFQFEKALSKRHPMKFLHSIQTNGYNIDQDWIRLFKREDVDVGISIDGPAELNQHFNASGPESCTNRVLRNIKMLSDADVPFGVISVITNRHTAHAETMYRFCKENGIHDLSLNFCYNNESDDSVANDRLIPFLKELFHYYFYGDYPLNIREFNEIIAKMSGYTSDTCATCNRENCGQYMAFDSCGNVFFCDNAYEKSSAIGNLHNTSLYDIIDSTKYLETIIKSRKAYEDHCQRCDVSHICGSGCYRYDNPTGDNYFCPTMKSICRFIMNEVAKANGEAQSQPRE